MYEHKTWGWREWLAINHQKIFMFIYLELLKHGNTKQFFYVTSSDEVS